MREQRVEVPPFPTKFLAGALAFVGIAFAWFTWNIYQSYRVAEMVKERYLRIEELRGMIVHLDEVLTMSARMAAATGDPQWEERYRQFEPPLDAAIKEAIALAPYSDVAKLAAQTDEANRQLVEMENRAFALVRAGRPAAARAVLFSDEYERQKKVYAQGMRNFTTELDEFLRATLRWERDKAIFSLIVTLVVLASSASAWIAVVRLLRQWRVIILAALRRAEEALRGKTDLLTNTSHELRTPLKSIIGFWGMLRSRTIGPLERKDEIGVLVEAIDQMAASLHTTTVSRAYLDNILRSMADPLIVLEADATIRSVNLAALELLQYEGHELAGKPARVLFGTDAFGEEGIADLLRTGFLRNIESTCVTKDGREIPVSLSGSVMRDGDGQLEALRLFRGKGCRQCGGSGFRGRLGLFELFEVTDRIRGMVMERQDAVVIRVAAVAGGMRTMFQDGLAKALLGETTLEEVVRVTL